MSCHRHHLPTLNDAALEISERCLSDNCYPSLLARDWMVLHPCAATCFTLTELADAVADIMVEIESQD